MTLRISRVAAEIAELKSVDEVLKLEKEFQAQAYVQTKEDSEQALLDLEEILDRAKVRIGELLGKPASPQASGAKKGSQAREPFSPMQRYRYRQAASAAEAAGGTDAYCDKMRAERKNRRLRPPPRHDELDEALGRSTADANTSDEARSGMVIEKIRECQKILAASLAGDPNDLGTVAWSRVEAELSSHIDRCREFLSRRGNESRLKLV